MLASMLEAASVLCPHVMKMSGLGSDLLKAGAGKLSVPRTFITKTLLEQAGVDILNKIRWRWARPLLIGTSASVSQ